MASGPTLDVYNTVRATVISHVLVGSELIKVPFLISLNYESSSVCVFSFSFSKDACGHLDYSTCVYETLLQFGS